jgi:hypothetical protein
VVVCLIDANPLFAGIMRTTSIATVLIVAGRWQKTLPMQNVFLFGVSATIVIVRFVP